MRMCMKIFYANIKHGYLPHAWATANLSKSKKKSLFQGIILCAALYYYANANQNRYVWGAGEVHVNFNSAKQPKGKGKEKIYAAVPVRFIPYQQAGRQRHSCDSSKNRFNRDVKRTSLTLRKMRRPGFRQSSRIYHSQARPVQYRRLSSPTSSPPPTTPFPLQI